MRVWPLAIGLQERVANHPKRRWSKAWVVSVMEKVLKKSIRYGSRKTNNRELPFKCRKHSDDIKTGGVMLLQEQSGRYLLTGQAVSGIEAASA